MRVSFNPAVSFRQQSVQQPQTVAASATTTAEIPKKKDVGLGFREGISNIAKFFVNLNEMTKASLKAVGYGALTAVGTMTGYWALGAFPRGFKEGNSVKDVFKHPIKNISKKGKVVSAVAALGVASYHLIKGKLVSNQRTANVDHQLKTGHREV